VSATTRTTKKKKTKRIHNQPKKTIRRGERNGFEQPHAKKKTKGEGGTTLFVFQLNHPSKKKNRIEGEKSEKERETRPRLEKNEGSLFRLPEKKKGGHTPPPPQTRKSCSLP